MNKPIRPGRLLPRIALAGSALYLIYFLADRLFPSAMLTQRPGVKLLLLLFCLVCGVNGVHTLWRLSAVSRRGRRRPPAARSTTPPARPGAAAPARPRSAAASGSPRAREYDRSRAYRDPYR